MCSSLAPAPATRTRRDGPSSRSRRRPQAGPDPKPSAGAGRSESKLRSPFVGANPRLSGCSSRPQSTVLGGFAANILLRVWDVPFARFEVCSPPLGRRTWAGHTLTPCFGMVAGGDGPTRLRPRSRLAGAGFSPSSGRWPCWGRGTLAGGPGRAGRGGGPGPGCSSGWAIRRTPNLPVEAKAWPSESEPGPPGPRDVAEVAYIGAPRPPRAGSGAGPLVNRQAWTGAVLFVSFPLYRQMLAKRAAATSSPSSSDTVPEDGASQSGWA